MVKTDPEFNSSATLPSKRTVSIKFKRMPSSTTKSNQNYTTDSSFTKSTSAVTSKPSEDDAIKYYLGDYN